MHKFKKFLDKTKSKRICALAKQYLLPLFFCLTLYAQAQAPTNGLVGYYPFNGNANDASGNNNNGVVTNVTLTTDRTGAANKAYQFGGYDSPSWIKVSNDSNKLLICSDINK